MSLTEPYLLLLPVAVLMSVCLGTTANTVPYPMCCLPSKSSLQSVRKPQSWMGHLTRCSICIAQQSPGPCYTEVSVTGKLMILVFAHSSWLFTAPLSLDSPLQGLKNKLRRPGSTTCTSKQCLCLEGSVGVFAFVAEVPAAYCPLTGLSKKKQPQPQPPESSLAQVTMLKCCWQ